ncbi:type II toxin-antitoxin system prevent-host-death family antitoxin [Streptomyces sp. NPDC020480]|uniref:type II toxin-antitoxin system prevent-host-death family antitoxin n=1 Tax=Streptomyces sp. NPDC020480 TaxID=3365076 RepID=UPI0037A501C3
MSDMPPTGDHSRPTAAMTDLQQPAEPEEALALADYRARQANGTFVGIPHEEVRRRLGLEQT